MGLCCRMVQANLERIVNLDPKRHLRAAIQTPYPLRPLEDEGTKTSDKIDRDGEDIQDPGLLHWQRFLARQRGKNDNHSNHTCRQEGAISDKWPTHFQTFRCQEEYHLVKQTYMFLQHSGFYWGPISMESAHQMLRATPPGSFLIRDSYQSDVFFTLSYQGDTEPSSVRLLLTNQHFSLDGSHRTFGSLFALLAHYTTSSSKIVAPYRHQRPEGLQQLSRKAVIRAHGADTIDALPGLSGEVKGYLHSYPYWL